MYSIEELEEIMVAHGVVLRAIPRVETSTLEAQHRKDYPTGEIKYLPEYKREMLIVKSFPELGGKFLVETNQGTSSMVRFCGKRYFSSIGEAIDLILTTKKEDCET